MGEAYAQAVRDSHPQLAIADAVQSERQVSSESLFSSKQEAEALTLWGVKGSIPWSLPPFFGEELD